MDCPVCGQPSFVMETKNGKRVWRRRECLACKARWSTEEKMIPGTIADPAAKTALEIAR